jgi:hypothetical protein
MSASQDTFADFVEIVAQSLDDAIDGGELARRAVSRFHFDRVVSAVAGEIQLAMWNAAVAGQSYDFGIEQDESLGSMRRRLADAGPEFETLAEQLVTEGPLEERSSTRRARSHGCSRTGACSPTSSPSAQRGARS